MKLGITAFLLIATIVPAVTGFHITNLVWSEPVQPQSNTLCSSTCIRFKDTRDPWVVLYDWAWPLNLSILVDAYGSTPTDSNWNPQCDIYPWPKGDGQIELMDFFVISQHFGET